MKKILCLILAFVFLFLTASCGKEPQHSTPNPPREPQPVYAAVPQTLAKKEAVFATLSATGEVQTVQVTDRLLTDSAQVRVEDITFLSDIENINGPELAQIDGVHVTWHMQSDQLYYTGKTNKQLPVALHIRYYLNDKPVQASALRGKKGEVCIEVQAENTLLYGNFYMPFLLVGGAILENVRQVRVTNGSTLGDGRRDIAFGVLLPGMNKNLALDDLLPEHFTIRFVTEDFSLTDLFFAMVPLSTAKLSDAVSSVFGAVDLPQVSFSELLYAVQDFGRNTDVQSFLQSAPESIELLRAAAKVMRDLETVQPLLQLLQKYLTAENAQLLQETLDSLTVTSMREYLSLMQDPTFLALLTDMGAVSSAFATLIPEITALLTALQGDEMRACMASLPQVLDDLRSLTDRVGNDTQWLNTLTNLSENGTLTQFSTLLRSVQGMMESGALQALSALSARTEDLEMRLNAVLELGKKYGIFTVAPENAATSVYFVLKVNL